MANDEKAVENTILQNETFEILKLQARLHIRVYYHVKKIAVDEELEVKRVSDVQTGVLVL